MLPSKYDFRLSTMRRTCFWILASLLVYVAPFLHGATNAAPVVSGALDLQNVVAPPEGATGSQLAQIYCQICHVLPRPDLLDKKTWREQTLPRMKVWLGLAPESIERNKDAKWLKASGRFPTKPILPLEQFERIVDFYVAKAPAQPIPQAPHSEIEIGFSI